MNTPKIVTFAPLSNIDNIQRSRHWETDEEIREMYAVTGCAVLSIEPDYDTIYGRNWERDADLVHRLLNDDSFAPVIISGGEVLEVHPYRAASMDNLEDMPL